MSALPTAQVEAILSHVLNRELGLIPDPVEPWLSLRAIASIIGREPGTLENWLSARRKEGAPLPESHPAGGFYRLSEFVRIVFDGRTARGGKPANRTAATGRRRSA